MDIDASDLTDSIASFSGTLNGNGYRIKNLKCPLFGLVNNATIENIELTGVNITGTKEMETGASDIKVGALAKEISHSTVLNVTVAGNIDVSVNNNSLVGGLCGFASRSEFNSCSFDGSIAVEASDCESYVGGISGMAWIQDAPGKYIQCTTYGSITSNSASKAFLAGIVGQFTAVGWDQGSIAACGTEMVITGSATEMKAAGIAGVANHQAVVKESFSSARIDVAGSADCVVGGIIGYGELNTNIFDCYVLDASLTAKVIEVGKESFAGGIVGFAWGDPGIMYIENCVVQGSAINATNAGGIAGFNSHNSAFTNCYFNGTESAFGKTDSGNTPVTNVEHMSDQELSDPGAYANWGNFDDAWSLEDGELSLNEVPMSEPKPEPTPTPTSRPTATPTSSPTSSPTATPTAQPTVAPTPTAAPQKPPKTGDSSQLVLWMALLVLSVGGGCALLIRNRRRTNNH